MINWWLPDSKVIKINLVPFSCKMLTTTQLAIYQYTPMKHRKLSCQKHKIDSLLLLSRCMTNYMKSCSFLHAYLFE